MALTSYDASWRFQCPKTGLMLPWYTESCLEWLLSKDWSNSSVLELGAGYSTMWWRANAKNVVSVDLDPVWAKATNSNQLEFNLNDYDLIVIDGHDRYEMLIMALSNNPPKYIIVDNWMQDSVPIDWQNAPEIVSMYKHTVFQQNGHPDWETLVIEP